MGGRGGEIMRNKRVTTKAMYDYNSDTDTYQPGQMQPPNKNSELTIQCGIKLISDLVPR